MLAPIRIAPPEATPVSLVEAKTHLRVDFDDDDTLIASLIDVATAHVDGWSGILGRALVTQTWRQDFCAFGCRLRLPLAPVQSITEISYYDGDNHQQTLAADVYNLLADARGPFLALNRDKTYPGTYRREDAVSVTFAAGYGDADAVPAPIKAAILMMVAHLYENREAVAVGSSLAAIPLPMAVDALLAPYRRVGV